MLSTESFRTSPVVKVQYHRVDTGDRGTTGKFPILVLSDPLMWRKESHRYLFRSFPCPLTPRHPSYDSRLRGGVSTTRPARSSSKVGGRSVLKTGDDLRGRVLQDRVGSRSRSLKTGRRDSTCATSTDTDPGSLKS